jgi:phosphoribosylaminoimidazole-succinocarboxamide synthase
VSAERALTEIDLPLRKVASGKVREMFEVSGDRLMIVSTDRISAFDVVMNEGIPDKGRVLTALTLVWLDLLGDVCPHHLISDSAEDLRSELADDYEKVRGRAMLVKRLDMLPVEFVVRGYLAGSGWKDYQATGSLCGIPLPEGLRQAEELPEPLFTPATKETDGHDVNISEDQAADICGPENLKQGKEYALELYRRGREHARARGIILADTKFEFGLLDGEVVLGDEVLTPDSSRFWPADSWKPGESPPSFDKQYLRDWLEQSEWDKSPPPPTVPDDVVMGTRARYVEAYERLSDETFEEE